MHSQALGIKPSDIDSDFVMCVANRNFRCTDQSPATVSSVSALVVPKSVFTAADTAVAIEGRCVTWGKRVVVMTYS